MAFEVSSLNAGLKTYILQQDNPAYSAREKILKDLFRRYGKAADQYVIYEDLQGIDRSVESALPPADWLSDLALIKVYVSLWDISKLSKVFCETVRLLAYSDNRFHAKVSRVKRKDSMCFWVSRHAFHILESHFSECSDVIGGAMPFIAYRGRLGISRELATFDSHNSEQALLISSSIWICIYRPMTQQSILQNGLSSPDR